MAGTHLTAARTLHEMSSSFSSHAHGVLKCELVLDYMHTASRHVLMFRTKLGLQESSIQTEGSYCGCLYPHTWDNPDQIRTFFINTTYTTCIPNIVGDGKRGGGGGSSQYDLFFHSKHEPKDCGSVSTPMAAVLWLSLHAHGCRPVAQSPRPWLPSCGSVSTPMAAVLWLSLHAHGCRPVAQSPHPWLPSCAQSHAVTVLFTVLPASESGGHGGLWRVVCEGQLHTLCLASACFSERRVTRVSHEGIPTG